MLTLESFYRAHKDVLGVDECSLLPTACITAPAINFVRLPKSVRLQDQPFDNLFNSDFTAKIEELSPLSINILESMNAAGCDPHALRYRLSINEDPVVQVTDNFWHTDKGIFLNNFRNNIWDGSGRIKTVLSNVFPTATIANGSFDFCPDGLDRSLYFLCMLKAVAPSNINFVWKKAAQGFGEKFKDDNVVREFVRDIRRKGKKLRLQKVTPSTGYAVHFNHVMPHCLTCRFVNEKPFPPGTQMRHRVILSSSRASISR